MIMPHAAHGESSPKTSIRIVLQRMESHGHWEYYELLVRGGL